MEERQKKKQLKKLVLVIAAELFLAAAAVWFFDPFYQYHPPFFGVEAVLNDRDNQMPGTVRNFDYDSVLIGSSVAENCDSSFLDETYGCRTLKVIRASGSLADLLYYLEMACQEHRLRNVFWCMDILALDSSTKVTYYDGNTPLYLHTKTVLDDIPYLFNKEILLEKIPAALACSYSGINTGGNAYNWAEGKVFGASGAMAAYDRNSVKLDGLAEPKDFSEQKQLIIDNIAMLDAQIDAHPETTFRFFFPPYSLLWWDCAYVNGDLEERLFVLEETLPALLAHENVEVYYFQDEEDIVCNLDYYMDMIHYSPDINQVMLERMAAGKNRVTKENLQEVLESMRALTVKISEEEIYRYYSR